MELRGCLVTSLDLKPSAGWAGQHLQQDVHEYLHELRAEYEHKKHTLQQAHGLRKCWLRLLAAVGLFKLRRYDVVMAHFSCKDIGMAGRAHAPSSRDVHRALQLPLELLLDTSGLFPEVYVENPARGALERAWRRLGHQPPQVVQFWQFGDPADDRNRTTKPTAIFSGCQNKVTKKLMADNRAPPRRGLLDTLRDWMDMWGVGKHACEDAREATPPGLAHAYARDLLCS